jgi:hypothetical protein
MQRAKEKARKEAGLPYNAKFFVNAEDDEESANWSFKNEITVNREFLEYVSLCLPVLSFTFFLSSSPMESLPTKLSSFPFLRLSSLYSLFLSER